MEAETPSHAWRDSIVVSTRYLNYHYLAMCVFQLLEARRRGMSGDGALLCISDIVVSFRCLDPNQRAS
jgi:hypothetical protein